jgi:hypothetical protein
MIDRVSPTLRPSGRVRGYQKWRSLLFLHWPVPVDALRKLVPASLELDLFNGVAYVGVVPFIMQGVRPWWWPEPLAFRFLETNVRTYVCHRDRPGVYFFSLEASSRLAVWAARQFWGLPYHYASMRVERNEDEIRYHSERSRTRVRHSVRFRVGERLGPSQPDSLEFFFLERYLLFVERRHQVYVGHVHHVPYPAQRVESVSVADDLVAAAGLDRVSGKPEFTHYASGVDVEIFGLRAAGVTAGERAGERRP